MNYWTGDSKQILSGMTGHIPPDAFIHRLWVLGEWSGHRHWPSSCALPKYLLCHWGRQITAMYGQLALHSGTFLVRYAKLYNY